MTLNVGPSDGTSGDIPTGTIAMWSGSISNIPNGWTLCDGNSGAPNLQDKFVAGAGSAYSVGATAGTDNVSLSTGQLPSHDHGDGTLDVNSHDHGNGTLDADSHDHGNGTLTVASHDHGTDPNNIGVDDHTHGPGNLDALEGAPGDTNAPHSHSVRYAETTVASGSGETVFNVSGSSDATGSVTDGAITAGDHGHNVGNNSVTPETSSESPALVGSVEPTSPNVNSGSTGSTSVNVSGSTSSTSPGVHGSTGSTGSDNSHENRPQFYAVAYIYKE